MTFEPDDFNATFKAMPIFYSMRSNLAMMDAFFRRSIIETSNYKGEDLGFFGIAPGEKQLNTHNLSVTSIVVALSYQCLENYFHLTKVIPRLGDPSLEDFLNRMGGRRRFMDGMKTIRKGVFHVRSARSWRNPGLKFFYEVCKQRGGILVVMKELRKTLYDFTEKVFMGKLRIWPDSVYEKPE